MGRYGRNSFAGAAINLIGYIASLVLAIAAGFLLLDGPAANILAFAFVVWLGGWFAHADVFPRLREWRNRAKVLSVE